MTALTISQFYPQSEGYAQQNDVRAALGALRLYNRSLLAGRLDQVWSRLLGRSNSLFDLEEVRSQSGLSNSHYAGTRSVSIDQIRGSQGRSADFDAQFRPLHERTRDRWVSVATALQNGVSLPPVELVQVGESYFVRDGHHRISVARALGQMDVDAEITIIELNDR